MTAKRKPLGYWTKEKVLETARKYRTAKEWRTLDRGCYSTAVNKGWYAAASKHMVEDARESKWTAAEIKARAAKYKTRSEWQQKSSLSYKRARELGLIDKLMPARKKHRWTKEEVLADAAKYKTLPRWELASGSAYNASIKNEWHAEATAHMPRFKKWTFSAVKADAAKYNTRAEWFYASRGAYKAADKNGWVDEVCSHMQVVGNEWKRCIYVIRLDGRKAYVGLTANFERRMREHAETKRFKGRAHEMRPKQLTGYVHKELAVQLEAKFLEKYRKLGYAILNTTKTGGLGGDRLVWTKEKVLAAARRYPTKTAFMYAERSAYAAAYRGGYLAEIAKACKTG